MAAEVRLCDEKASKAMVDAARLADELRCEQEAAQMVEKNRHFLEAQLKDMQMRLDDAETNALKGGKKAMNKMDSRIRELESELDAENRRMGDAMKNLRKSERHIQELTFASRARSGLTRSRLRRLKRLLLSTWPNSRKFRDHYKKLEKELI